MKPGPSLPPSVQERLSGWVQIQERRAQNPGLQRPGPAITLSRQFGCEGFPAALRLQERLSGSTGTPWSLFDKALIEKVALDEGIPMPLLNEPEGPGRGLEAFGFHPRGAVTGDEAFAKVAETLVKVALQGHAIIVGRGGAVLCRGLDNAFHFRLEADLAWRVESYRRRMGCSLGEAEAMVKSQSRLRDRFIHDRLGADVADPGLYDAVFNNGRHSVEEIAAAMEAYVLSAWGA